MKSFSAAFLVIALCYAFSACKKDNPPVEPVTNKTIFMSDVEGGLYAFNAQTGAKLWETHDRDLISDGFIVAGNLLYVPTYDETLQAHDMATGKLKWEVSFEHASPRTYNVVVSNGVLCTSGGEHLVGLDANTGQKKWEIDSLSVRNLYAKNGVIYMEVGSRIIAVESSTGSIKWDFKTPKGSGVQSVVIIDEENLYAYLEGAALNSSGTQYIGYQSLLTIDLKTGILKKNQSFPYLLYGGRLIGSSPEHLFIRHRDETGYHIICYSKENGQLGWNVPEKELMGFSSPFYSNSFVYMGSDDGIFYKMNINTGDFSEVFRVNEVIRSSPVVANGMIYVGSNYRRGTIGTLYAVEEATGEIKWSVPINGNLAISSPVVLDSNGRTYHYGESAMVN